MQEFSTKAANSETDALHGDDWFQSTSPEQTQQLAAELAATLHAGDVVALHGDLGSGKTTFIKGVCSALGVPQEVVTSPTFTLVHEYSGRVPLYHFDFYRIEDEREFVQLGCEDYFYGDGICLIEWADRIASYLPAHSVRVFLRAPSSAGVKNHREIAIPRR